LSYNSVPLPTREADNFYEGQFARWLACDVIFQAVIDACLDVIITPDEDVSINGLKRWRRNWGLRRDAWKWVISENKGEMSFWWYCNLAGIDPTRARNKLRKLSLSTTVTNNMLRTIIDERRTNASEYASDS
jgi:hypothetical protein